MKKLFALFVFCLSVSAPSFGAEHLVGRSARFAGKESFSAGKESFKAAKFSAKEAGRSGEAVVKFLL
jgi:hypothetical protein